MHVYLQEAPRALVLVPNAAQEIRFALVVSTHGIGNGSQSALPLASQSSSRGTRPGTARLAAELLDLEELSLESMRNITPSPAQGCLGIMNIGQDCFLAIVTSASVVGDVRPGETAMKINSVSFFCVNKSTWDDTVISTGAYGIDRAYDGDASMTGQSSGDVYQSSIYEHPCAAVKKYMSNGTFYYAKDSAWDISTRLDRRCSKSQDHDISQYDDRFLWNSYMLEPLMEYRSRMIPEEQKRLDAGGFLLCAIQGYVGVQSLGGAGYMSDIPVTSNISRSQTTVSLISRLSWKRAGTRFNSRGIDDDGNVANFVESELLFCHTGVTYSHVQVRGSVPLFWEQSGLQALNSKIQITRPQAASQAAFDRHFADLLAHYSRVHALNLLGIRDIETVLTTAYIDHMKMSSAVEQSTSMQDGPLSEKLNGEEDQAGLERVGLTNFDFHSTTRMVGGIDGIRNELRRIGSVSGNSENFAFTIIDREGATRIRQGGVFRTNCLDCLDRTNVVQDFLSQFTISLFFARAAAAEGTGDSFVGFSNSTHPIWGALRSLWGHNGDALSRIYAGTGALNTSFTKSGKKTLGGFLSNAVKSAARTYINNFQDKDKQNVIDSLLGLMANQQPVRIIDVVHDAIEEQLLDRLSEYSEKKEITIFAGTWNVNGRPPGESLLPWLLPDGKTEPDIFALGFQEIVELTPGQILMTDPTKKKVWEAAIMNTFAQRTTSDKAAPTKYVLLRSEQLVGAALIIIVKQSLLPAIRAVEASTKKTGLKGMSGNKGGVAVRLTCFDTSICFLTAHFAAGQSNYEERNADYHTISQGLVFSRGKTIASHDLLIWLGDFNYRIDLPNEQVRQLAQNDDLDPLFACDQLIRAKGDGRAFAGLQEGPLLFRPTYKYDNNRDTYDSSEKARIPAWTDRIIYRPDGLHQRTYYRAELRTSDHRPVYGIFAGDVRSIDHAKRGSIYDGLLEKIAPGRRAAQAFRSGVGGSKEQDNLPYPSSEAEAWWEADALTSSAVPPSTRRLPPPRPPR